MQQHSTMASSSGLSTALNITELASALARYLTGRDLSRCIQVNKAWFTTFTLHIWESPRVSDHGFRSRSEPTLSRYRLPEENPDWNLALRRYGHLHEFALGSTAVLCSIFEHNTMTLTTVRITVTLQDDMGALTETLRLVSTLQELVIFDMAPPRTRNHYLDVLVDACAPTTNLRRLVCFQGTVHENALRLPTLVATHGAQELGTPIRTKVDGAGPESIRGIQELRWSIPCLLEVDDRDRVVRMLRGCGPALQRLHFDAFADEKAEYLFDVVQRSCTNLRQLSFATSNDIQGNNAFISAPPQGTLTDQSSCGFWSFVRALRSLDTFTEGTPARIICTEASLREEHASIKYSKRLKCYLNGDENLVAVFDLIKFALDCSAWKEVTES
ncbi:MAG: hypothetical protein J3R72DRAFT_499581 [Linnemannia gamsii]|nr:MAG: hypothetical protein J3R72DRAFT_499581 [Linnemannia gamsii]